MRRFQSDFLQQLKDRVDIADIIGSYVTLKRRAAAIGDAVRFIRKKRLPFLFLLKKDFIIVSGVMLPEMLFPFL